MATTMLQAAALTDAEAWLRPCVAQGHSNEGLFFWLGLLKFDVCLQRLDPTLWLEACKPES